MPRVIAALLVLALGTSARADLFWIPYEGTVLPEQNGWTRVFQSPGGSRFVSGGIFTLNTLGQPNVYDFNFRQATAIIDPGEELALEWSTRVTGTLHDTFVMIGQGAAFGGQGVSIGPDAVQVSESVNLPITPGVFHSYRLATSDLRTFRLWIDGTERWTFPQVSYQPGINVLFGDWTTGGALNSRSEWDYVRFGVVPAPGTIVPVMLAVAVMAGRRRRG